MNVEERNAALILSKSIALGQKLIEEGETKASVVVEKMTELLKSEPMADVEYVNVVDNLTMEDIDEIRGDVLVAIAVRINNKVRLIDNFIVNV
jgi:pantoate--beta-alanine ligase